MARTSIVFVGMVLIAVGCQQATTPMAPIATTAPIATHTQSPTPTTIPTPVIPMIAVVDNKGRVLHVPDPKASNPGFFDLNNPDSPIVEYANAFGMEPGQVGELTPVVKTAPDGTEHVVLETNGYILLELMANGKWEKPTLRLYAARNNIGFGTSVDGAERFQDHIYRHTAGTQFSILMPSGSFMNNTFAKWGSSMAQDFTDLAIEYDMTLRIHPMFFHQDIPVELQANPTPDRVEAFMFKRAEQLMSYAKQTADKGLPAQITFASEARYFFQGRFDWAKSPYYIASKEDWVSKAYLIAYRAAEKYGLKVGKDVHLHYQDYYIEAPGADVKVNDTYRLLKQVKSDAARELNIPESDVEVGVGTNFHTHADSGDARGWGGPYTEDLFRPGSQRKVTDIINKFGKIGPVHITEFDVSGTTDLSIKDKAVQIALGACLDSKGKCKSFTFWDDLRFKQPYQEILFDESFKPTIVFYDTMKQLSDRYYQKQN